MVLKEKPLSQGTKSPRNEVGRRGLGKSAKLMSRTKLLLIIPASFREKNRLPAVSCLADHAARQRNYKDVKRVLRTGW